MNINSKALQTVIEPLHSTQANALKSCRVLGELSSSHFLALYGAAPQRELATNMLMYSYLQLVNVNRGKKTPAG